MQKPTLRRLPLLLAAAFASEWIHAADAAQNAEQAAGGVGDGLLFAGGHDGRKVLILFIKGFH